METQTRLVIFIIHQSADIMYVQPVKIVLINYAANVNFSGGILFTWALAYSQELISITNFHMISDLSY